MSTVAMGHPTMFGDKMYTSTDLNRRSAEVLDSALKQPVTISRNSEQFALMPREQAAMLYRTLSGVLELTQLLAAVATHLYDGTAPAEQYSWLGVYEKDDLQRFTSELTREARRVLSEGCAWDDVDGVIHAWKESALVAKSGLLDHAMFVEDADEQPLPPLHEETERGE